MAVPVSMLAHALLAVVVLCLPSMPAPAPPADSVEVAFDVPETSLEQPVAPPESFGVPGQGGERPRSSPTPRRAAEHHVRSGPQLPADGEGGQVVSNETPPQGPRPPAGQGAGDRFASFRPGRPDLSRAPGWQVPEGKRDPLAAPSAPAKAKAPRELPRHILGPGGVSARIDEDGKIHFRDPGSVVIDQYPVTVIDDKPTFGMEGHFDLNDHIARLAGQDPYAATKRKMAEETHEQRLCMARRAQHTREAQALFDLSTKVRTIAGRKDWSPEKRRRTLFEFWDDCDGDSDYAAMARATITAIIRQSFPEDTPLAYQPQELLALNKQRASRQEFAPYLVQESRRPAPIPEECSPPDAARSID